MKYWAKRILLMGMYCTFLIPYSFSQTTLTVGVGQSVTINTAASYTSIVITGGTLVVSGGVNITTDNLTIAGTSSNTGVCRITGANTKLTANANTLMNQFNTSLIVENNAQFIFNAHSFQATPPRVTSINVNTGAEMKANNGLNLNEGVNLSVNTGKLNVTGGIVLNGSTILSISGINALLTATQLNLNAGLADFRLLNNATATLSAEFNISSSSAVANITNNAKLIASQFNANSGTVMSEDQQGIVLLSGNFNNSVGASLSPSGKRFSIVMSGAGIDQQINNGPSIFNNFTVEGSAGSVLANGNVQVEGTLNLVGNRLLKVNTTFKINNPSPSSVVRAANAGYVVVLYDQSRFIRNTNSTSSYLFPVGAATIYRPVTLTPALNTASSYSVSCLDRAPYIGFNNNIGASIIAVDQPSIKRVNTTYHHEIRDELPNNGSVPATIYITYDPVVDGSSFNALAQHISGAWNALQSPLTLTNQAGVTPYEITNSNVAYVLVNGVGGAPAPSYAVLNKKLDGGRYNTINSRVYFMFEEEYALNNAASLRYNVYEAKSNTLMMSSTPTIAAIEGVGFYELLVSSLASNNTYVLEVINTKNEKWYLRFNIQ